MNYREIAQCIMYNNLSVEEVEQYLRKIIPEMIADTLRNPKAQSLCMDDDTDRERLYKLLIKSE